MTDFSAPLLNKKMDCLIQKRLEERNGSGLIRVMLWPGHVTHELDGDGGLDPLGVADYHAAFLSVFRASDTNDGNSWHKRYELQMRAL